MAGTTVFVFSVYICRVLMFLSRCIWCIYSVNMVIMSEQNFETSIGNMWLLRILVLADIMRNTFANGPPKFVQSAHDGSRPSRTYWTMVTCFSERPPICRRILTFPCSVHMGKHCRLELGWPRYQCSVSPTMAKVKNREIYRLWPPQPCVHTLLAYPLW